MTGGPFFPRSDRSIRRQIESIHRKRLAKQKVVDLVAYRGMQKSIQIPKVLVVDDDEIMRNALKRILEIEGFSVQLAEDGMELSAILENSRLDLILLDVNLPWVDGIELCQLIKGNGVFSEVPLIMVSGRSSELDIEKAFKAGCDDYITKPFDVSKLTGAVHAALEKKSS